MKYIDRYQEIMEGFKGPTDDLIKDQLKFSVDNFSYDLKDYPNVKGQGQFNKHDVYANPELLDLITNKIHIENGTAVVEDGVGAIWIDLERAPHDFSIKFNVDVDENIPDDTAWLEIISGDPKLRDISSIVDLKGDIITADHIRSIINQHIDNYILKRTTIDDIR